MSEPAQKEPTKTEKEAAKKAFLRAATESRIELAKRAEALTDARVAVRKALDKQRSGRACSTVDPFDSKVEEK